MRHLGSIVFGILLAPVIWALAGIGAAKFVEPAQDLEPDMFTVAVGLGALVGAGLAYAMLLFPRLSPLGPALAGAAMLGASLWAVLAPDFLIDRVPTDLLGVVDAILRPLPLAPLLAVPLLVTLGIPRRWRGHDLPHYALTPTYPTFSTTQPDLPTTPLYTPPAPVPTWPPKDTDDTRRL
jgi:hypothetical protein